MSDPLTVEQCLVYPTCLNEEAESCLYDVLHEVGFGIPVTIWTVGLQGGGKSHICNRLQEGMPEMFPEVGFECTGADRVLGDIGKTYSTRFEEDKDVRDLADRLPEWIDPKPTSAVGVAHALAQVKGRELVCERSGSRAIVFDNTNPTPGSISLYIKALPADIGKIAVIMQPEFTPTEKLHVDKLLELKYAKEHEGANQWSVMKALKPAVDELEHECDSLWRLLHQSENCRNPVATAYTMLQVLTNTQKWIDYADRTIVVQGHRKIKPF